MASERRENRAYGVRVVWYRSGKNQHCYLCNSTIPAGSMHRRTRIPRRGGGSKYLKACEECAQVDEVTKAMLEPGMADNERMEQEEATRPRLDAMLGYGKQ